METKDHLLLANRLLQSAQKRLPRRFVAGVRLGSILPDCNPFTYLRGIRRGQGLHGHNAEITDQKISGLISCLTQTEGVDFLCGLRLGTALHYLADAFTYPHHDYYPGTLADHVAYENVLHRAFAEYLSDDCVLTNQSASDFPAYLRDMLALYHRCRKSEYSDCRFITHMCHIAFETVLGYQSIEEEISNENSDYNRPVPAVR